MTSLDDELTSINSIYAENTLEPVPDSAPTVCILRPPSVPGVSLRIEFPPDYPDAPPSILGTQTVGEDVPKGFGRHVVDVFRSVLATVYRPGEPCIFDLLEDVAEAVEAERARLEAEEEEKRRQRHAEATEASNDSSSTNSKDPQIHSATAPSSHSPPVQLSEAPPWTITDALVEKKSVFVARVAPVSSPAVAHAYLSHLIATDKHVAKATHNITAWRIRDPSNPAITYQDCDDDGETAAGGRVLHLMQLMDVWDCMVVVTRWYGGVLLGPDRFRCINQVAREGFVKGGFVKEEKEGGKKGKSKKKLSE